MQITVNGLPRIVKILNDLGGYAANTYNWGGIIASEAAEALDGATETWTRQPRITITSQGGIGRSGASWLQINVNPALPFAYVDKGTRPHAIVPKRPGGVLVFNSRFGAKSRPNSLRSYVGHSRGPKVVTKAVWHPGVKPRNFTPLAVRRAEREGTKIVEMQVQGMIDERAAYYEKFNASKW